jgi:uncharacterized protein
LKTENQYIIAYKGLREGNHDFNFQIGKPFLEKHEFLEARDGKLAAKVNMVKEAFQLSFTITINGFIEVPCDRCLDYFPLEIQSQGNLFVKFSGQPGEYDDDILVLDPEEGEIDLSQYFYENISLSIPFRKIHPPVHDNEPGCRSEMLEKLEKYIVSGPRENNPLRDQLKDLQ